VDGYAIVVRRLPGAPRSSTPAHSAPAEIPADSAPRRLLRRAGRLGLNFVFMAMVASVLIMLVPAALGFQRYVILTGSMTGTYDRGSIVYDRPIPTSELRVGDPITYSPPPGFTSQTRVTHRIWSITRGAEGQKIYRTKGDANKHPDVWQFTLNQPTQDVVVFHVPDVGYVFTLLSLREFRIVLVGLPALIIGFIIMRGLWRDGGVEARRQKLAKLGWAEVADYGSEKPLPPLETPAESPRPIWLDLRFARSYGRPAQPANKAILRRPRTLLYVERITSAHAWPARASLSTSRPGRIRAASAGDRLTDQLRVGRLRSQAAPQDPYS
jgi:signal peptidase